jgi:Protein of unknown function (DUF2752)
MKPSDLERRSLRTVVIRRLALLSVAGVLIGGLVVLYANPPGSSTYCPKCVFHAATGLHCPGCGSSRCLHSLLHGEIRQAVAFNLFAVVALPFLIYFGWKKTRALLSNEPRSARNLHPWTIRLILILVIAFWILRNVEAAPFQWLAPHRL